ncbi:MAG: inorganic diphosphatase [Chloroflexi bacterium]|nr:inorganic diphosphatase [Chloroflexota bacterium]
MDSNDFWFRIDKLVATCNLIIDRPRGSTHPRYPSFKYPFDYGYLEGTHSGDQGGIDVWVGSLPERRVAAIVCTVDWQKRDMEVKILLGCSDQEAEEILKIHNKGAQSAILLARVDSQAPPFDPNLTSSLSRSQRGERGDGRSILRQPGDEG